MSNVTLFSQIIKLVDRELFHSLVAKHNTDYRNKGYNTWTHFVSMIFCHFAKSTSVRDISFGLNSATGNLNHLGIERAPSKSSISYQNERRSSAFFKDLYFGLLKYLGQHTQINREKLRIKVPVFLLDSTTIPLSLSLFDWAHFRTTKGAVKMHTVLDYDGNLPVYVCITDGKTADNKAVNELSLPEKSVIVADRYYNDFKLLSIWDSKKISFVLRHKENLQYRVLSDKAKPEKKKHLLADQVIEFANKNALKNYPKRLRRVVVWDEKNNQEIELITNNFTWSTETIGQLYKSRWNVEIFYRDIKELLHVKTFIGTSRNAVEIQLWTALITMLLLRVLKVRAKYKWHLSNLVGFIRLNIFVKIDLWSWLNQPILPPQKRGPRIKQGILFASD